MTKSLLVEVMDGYIQWCLLCLKWTFFLILAVAGLIHSILVPLFWLLYKLNIMKSFHLPKLPQE